MDKISLDTALDICLRNSSNIEEAVKCHYFYNLDIPYELEIT